MKVYVAPRKGYDHYHTDKGCVGLRTAKHVFEKPKEDVDDLELCSFCSGDFERDKNPAEGLRAKIERGEIDID